MHKFFTRTKNTNMSVPNADRTEHQQQIENQSSLQELERIPESGSSSFGNLAVNYSFQPQMQQQQPQQQITYPQERISYPWSYYKLALPPPTTPGVAPPTAFPFPRHGQSVPATATPSGEICVFGGIVHGQAQNDIYLISTTWSESYSKMLQTTGDLPPARFGHASALTGRVLVVWGGNTKGGREGRPGGHDTDLYFFKLSSREWKRMRVKGPTPAGRFGHTVAMIRSKFYVFGGQVDGTFLNDLWCFDLSSLIVVPTWDLIEHVAGSPRPSSRAGHVMIAYENKIIVFGGTDSRRNYNDTWVFDTSTRTWAELNCVGFIPSPREGHTAALVDDVVYVFGGKEVGGKSLDDLRAFKISDKRWFMFQNMGPTPSARSGHAMASVGPKVFLLGGLKPEDPAIMHVLDTSLVVYPESSKTVQLSVPNGPNNLSKPSITSPAPQPQMGNTSVLPTAIDSAKGTSPTATLNIYPEYMKRVLYQDELSHASLSTQSGGKTLARPRKGGDNGGDKMQIEKRNLEAPRLQNSIKHFTILRASRADGDQHLQEAIACHALALQLAGVDVKTAEFTGILPLVPYPRQYLKFISGLQKMEAQGFIDILDLAIDAQKPDSMLRHKCLKALKLLCGRLGTLPTSHLIRDNLKKTSVGAVSRGTFGEVWKGTYKDSSDVAIKVLKLYERDNLENIRKRFCREVVAWKWLRHPNIVPFLGASSLFRFCTVSEWMSQGDVKSYLRSHPNVDRVEILKDVVVGLQYLHGAKIVHGNLKGANILINTDGRACLVDFGLSLITSSAAILNASTNKSGVGAVRWMAPELFDETTLSPSIASDIYSFAMTTFEIFTETLPFSLCIYDATVIVHVLKGFRPERPVNSLELGLTDKIWGMVELCWRNDSNARPSTSQVLDCLMDK